MADAADARDVPDPAFHVRAARGRRGSGNAGAIRRRVRSLRGAHAAVPAVMAKPQFRVDPRPLIVMKTSTIEVGELLSTLSAAGVGRQLSTLPGVHRADVNYVAGSATVQYDESLTTLASIRQRVADCGYHCRGELVPAHVCEPADREPMEDRHAGHADHGSN